MAAIIKCTRAEAEAIRSRGKSAARLGNDWIFDVGRPLEGWIGEKAWGDSHLTFVVVPSSTDQPDDMIDMLAWAATLQGAADDFRLRKLRLSHIAEVNPPVPYSSVVARIPRRNQAYLTNEGKQSGATERALLDALLAVRPDLRTVIDEISRAEGNYPIGESRSAAVLALQRDATLTIARMAGMDLDPLARWSPPPEPLDDATVPPTYISRLAELPAHAESERAEPESSQQAIEERLLDHDAQFFLGERLDPAHNIHWYELRKFGQRLRIANVNYEAAENTLGVDLVYWNETRRCVVLVQAKRLRSSDGECYRPDSDKSLGSELERMRAVDKLADRQRQPDQDFRLWTRPCWFKLCKDLAYIPQTTDNIHGMYLAREQFETLRKDPRLKGERGGVVFSFENVPAYLDNSMFAKLVLNGLIGTSGSVTEMVRNLVQWSLDGHKALALGILSGEDMPQSKRNTVQRSRKLGNDSNKGKH
jgi:hypothetical protein